MKSVTAKLIIAGCLLSALAVIAGAFGAHAIRDIVSERLLKAFETGVRYHFFHAFALFVCAAVYEKTSSTRARIAGGFFVSGIVLFSGSLYAMALTGQSWLGAITPIGGVSFIVGWGVLAWSLRATSRKSVNHK